jgi:hypothetical protein
MNNSIGYLPKSQEPIKRDPWSFYVLSTINLDGSRLWVLDYKIKTFSIIFINSVTQYLIKIFRTFYRECFDTNDYIPNFYHQTVTTHFDVFLNIIKNIVFVSNYSLFDEFLKDVIIQKSCIIPTEYDFFNHLIYYDDDNKDGDNCKINIESLFDTSIDAKTVKIFEQINKPNRIL